MSTQTGLVRGMLGRLRYPWLFGVAATMLVADLVVPDVVPFVDEVLLAAATAGLAMLRKRRVEKSASPEDTEQQDGGEAAS